MWKTNNDLIDTLKAGERAFKKISPEFGVSNTQRSKAKADAEDAVEVNTLRLLVQIEFNLRIIVADTTLKATARVRAMKVANALLDVIIGISDSSGNSMWLGKRKHYPAWLRKDLITRNKPKLEKPAAAPPAKKASKNRLSSRNELNSDNPHVAPSTKFAIVRRGDGTPRWTVTEQHDWDSADSVRGTTPLEEKVIRLIERGKAPPSMVQNLELLMRRPDLTPWSR